MINLMYIVEQVIAALVETVIAFIVATIEGLLNLGGEAE